MEPITITIAVVAAGVYGAKKLNDLRKERAEERAKKQEAQQQKLKENNENSPIDK